MTRISMRNYLKKRFGNNRLVSKAYLTYFVDTKEPEQNAEEITSIMIASLMLLEF